MSYIRNNWKPKTKWLWLLGLLLIAIGSNAQIKVLEGQIENKRDIEGIHILNSSSRFNSVTDEKGGFYISAKALDTLVISSVTHIPEKVIITTAIFEAGIVSVTLTNLINELDEVVLGPRLSGNLEQDIKSIEVDIPLNFDDVGIPGFQGNPEEKIAPVVPGIGVDIESLYKHLSGYYKKLRLQRKWESQNVAVSTIMYYYTTDFFKEAFEIPEDRLYDFLLFCMETTNLQKDFENDNYDLVLKHFKTQAKEYISRLEIKEE